MKYIYAIADAPNEARVHVHRLVGLQVDGDQVLLTINSFVNETSPKLIWQDRYEMPMVEFNNVTYPEGVLQWIVSPTGLFPQGELVNEDSPLEAAQAKARATLRSMRDKHIHGGVLVEPFGIFQTDPDAIRNITGKSQRALVAQIEEETEWMTAFRLITDTMVPLDISGMLSVGKALDKHIEDCYITSWVHKAAIDAATSVDQVASIDLSAGWPVYANNSTTT